MLIIESEIPASRSLANYVEKISRNGRPELKPKASMKASRRSSARLFSEEKKFSERVMVSFY